MCDENDGWRVGNGRNSFSMLRSALLLFRLRCRQGHGMNELIGHGAFSSYDPLPSSVR